MAAAEVDPRIGQVIDGRYRILSAMAAGSMGLVYRAERVPVGKAVAVKFLHAAFATDPEFVGRFERETLVMSKLAHPHCVSVLDFGLAAGTPYLVMDFVAGTTLREILDDKTRLPPPLALNLTRQMLAGLAYAHHQRIVHRDIKPANVMITEEVGTGAHVRLLDFGLARLRGALGAGATQSNVVVGTPSYMAPEQTVGASVDARADVYAVGVVLYEMIVGDKPFVAEDTLDLLAMHRGAPVPRLATVVPAGTDLPAGLQEVVDRALAKDPKDRFQSAMEFAEAVEGLINGGRATPAAAAPTTSSDQASLLEERPRRRGVTRIAWFIAFLGVAAAAMYYAVFRADPATTPKRLAAAAVADAAVTSPPLAELDASLPVAVTMPLGDSDAATGLALLDAAGDVAVDDAAVAEITDGGATPSLLVDGDEGIVLEMEPDPVTAENPDPAGQANTEGTAGVDEEADDAPEAVSEDVVAEPPAPTREPLARTVNEAVQQIRAGKRDLALSSLRALWRKQRGSAYIPFLLGNLYFDQRWWSVAMDHYRSAIAKNAAYKRNATLNRNVIRMLGSAKTSGKANYFLRRTIGRPAKPYLRQAAKSDRNAKVRSRAAALVRAIR